MRLSSLTSLFVSSTIHVVAVAGLATFSISTSASNRDAGLDVTLVQLSELQSGPALIQIDNDSAVSHTQELPSSSVPEAQPTLEPVAKLEVKETISTKQLLIKELSKPIAKKPVQVAKQIALPRPAQAQQETDNKHESVEVCPPTGCGNNGRASANIGSKSFGESSKGVAVISGPKPEYPLLARRMGFQGSVLVDVLVDAHGRVQNAAVSKTSGRSDCDLSAVDTIKSAWVFAPAIQGGTTIAAKSQVKVNFILQ